MPADSSRFRRDALIECLGSLRCSPDLGRDVTGFERLSRLPGWVARSWCLRGGPRPAAVYRGRREAAGDRGGRTRSRDPFGPRTRPCRRSAGRAHTRATAGDVPLGCRSAARQGIARRCPERGGGAPLRPWRCGRPRAATDRSGQGRLTGPPRSVVTTSAGPRRAKASSGTSARNFVPSASDGRHYGTRRPCRFAIATRGDEAQPHGDVGGRRRAWACMFVSGAGDGGRRRPAFPPGPGRNPWQVGAGPSVTTSRGSPVRPTGGAACALGWFPTHWFYIVAAASPAVAGMFLIRSRTEHGPFPASTRLLSARGLGMVSIAMGEWQRRRCLDVESAARLRPSALGLPGDGADDALRGVPWSAASLRPWQGGPSGRPFITAGAVKPDGFHRPPLLAVGLVRGATAPSRWAALRRRS